MSNPAPLTRDSNGNITATCQRCGYQWQPRLNRPPKSCPACHQYAWRTPRASDQVVKPKIPPMQNWVVGDTPEACIPIGDQTAKQHGLQHGIKVVRARTAEEACK